MQEDFHYYATYCAAYLAGYSHKESLDICYSANFVDLCTKGLLNGLDAPKSAATTQMQIELADSDTNRVGLQDITRIWASFHFLPGDLNSEVKHAGKKYLDKYRLICDPDSDLVLETVETAKNQSLQAVGVAMHVLADTWAHRYFAGTPSLVINNINYHFYELLPDGEREVDFRHNPAMPDDLEKSAYTNTLYQPSENSIMNLGHGRAGHLPDYSFIRYKYMPAWGKYKVVVKDNPAEYMNAFCQMIAAMKYLRGESPAFEKGCYDTGAVAPYKSEIEAIIGKRQLIACDDWKAFGEKLSGEDIPPFDVDTYKEEYLAAPKDDKDETFLGKFFLAALAQKSMVTNRIFRSGNKLAGFSIEYNKKGFKGIKDFKQLIENLAESGGKNG